MEVFGSTLRPCPNGRRLVIPMRLRLIEISLTLVYLKFVGFSFLSSLVLMLAVVTVEALESGHPRPTDAIKMSVTGAGRLRKWFS